MIWLYGIWRASPLVYTVIVARDGYMVNGAGEIRKEADYPRFRCRTTTTAASPPERARANIHTVRLLKSPV